MKKIDVQVLFNKLISFEYEFLKYLNHLQGGESRPIDFTAAAEALGVDKRKVYNACKRLQAADALICTGDSFKIAPDMYL